MRISRQKKNKSFFTPNRLVLVVVSFILIEYVGLLFERYAESSQPRQLSEQNEKPQLRKAKAASGDTKKSNTPTASSFAKNNELVVKKESLQLHDTTDTALGTNKKSGAVLNDILSNYYPEGVWDDLLEEAAHQLQQHKSPGVAMEVGMHRPGKYKFRLPTTAEVVLLLLTQTLLLASYQYNVFKQLKLVLKPIA